VVVALKARDCGDRLNLVLQIRKYLKVPGLKTFNSSSLHDIFYYSIKQMVLLTDRKLNCSAILNEKKMMDIFYCGVVAYYIFTLFIAVQLTIFKYH
jgi:hypothetical protein